MVILLLLVVILSLLPMETDARSRRWRQERVVVYDYSGPDWAPYVQEAVQHFNAQLPARAPELVYVPMSGACQRHKRAITVCVVSLPDGIAGQTWAPVDKKRSSYVHARIGFDPSASPGLILPCHELTHALGVGSHGPWVDLRPCPYAETEMQHTYRKEKKRR